MAGMGLGWSNANSEMAGQLRQRIADQIAAKQRERDAAQQKFTNDRLTANDARQAEEHAAKMQDYRDSLALRQQNERDTAAGKALPNLGVGTAVEPSAFRQTYKGTSSESNFTPERTLPSTQTAGGVSLDASQPSVQKTTEAPRMITGRMLSMGTDQQRSAEDDKQKMSALTNDPNTPPALKQFMQLRGIMPKGENIPYQLITEPNGPPKPARQPVQVGPQGIFTDPADAIGKPGYHAPQQPIVVQTGAGPQLLNRGTGTASPIKDESGNDIGAKDSAQIATQKTNATNVRAHIAEVAHQADQIDKLGLMGPVGGRWAAFLAGKVGSADLVADPQQQELLNEFRTNVGLLKSGMAMVHGGARGGGSPAMMGRMDSLINADSMNLPLFKGSLKGFDKWLAQYEGKGGALPAAGSGGTVSMTAPDGRALSVPADKVAEMEAHGAKRVP